MSSSPDFRRRARAGGRKLKNKGGCTLRQRLLLVVLLPLLALSCAPGTYPYRAISGDCNCEEYSVRDGSVEYLFRARYSMDEGLLTRIEIEFFNRSHTDTLSLDVASVRVSSLNAAYEYNDKFLPLPPLRIRPRDSEIVHLEGKELAGKDDWHKIAGERLTVNLRGVTLGGKNLKSQEVVFVPENPKLKS
jgi:hypothetical protein